MKVGDKLYCHNNKNPYGSLDNYFYMFTIGEVYEIYSMYDDSVNVFNDVNRLEYFNILDEDYEQSYRNWFYTESDIRKLKLEKINESR